MLPGDSDGVRYVFDEGAIFIELHPLLVPMQAQTNMQTKMSAENAELEPQEISSDKLKKTEISMSFHLGWDYEIDSGIPALHMELDKLFRKVWLGEVAFCHFGWDDILSSAA